MILACQIKKPRLLKGARFFYSRSQRLDIACAYLYRVKQIPEVVRRNPV